MEFRLTGEFFFDTFSEWLCKYIGTKNKKLLQRLDRIHSGVFRQEFLPCIRFRSNILGIQTGWYGFRIEDINMLRKVGMDSERRIMTESDGMEWIQSWGKWQVQRGWDVFKAVDIDRFRRVVMYSELRILTDSDGLGLIQSCGQWKIRRIQICSVKHCPFYSRIVVMIDSNQIGMYILKLWHLQT